MNKFLLLTLMLLLGVLAFALGLFSKDSSTALSQYVPDSVGEMFSQKKSDISSELNKQKDQKIGNNAIAALVLPEIALPEIALPEITKAKQSASNTNTNAEVESGANSINTEPKVSFLEIPDELVLEMQQEVSIEASPEAIASMKQAVNKVESENQALKEKLQTLNVKANERDKVLQEIDGQIQDKLAGQKLQLNDRDKLLKELETQIQNLNH
jgi:hypothetical protein